MRSKQIKLSKTKTVDAILACGIQGIKVYLVPSCQSILLVKGKAKIMINEQELGYNELMNLINVKYRTDKQETLDKAYIVFIHEGLIHE